ncbi:MAG: DUF3108 domain-containing protein [Pseudomonadota bacterium]
MPWSFQPPLAIDSRWRPPVPVWRRRGQWGGVLLGVLLAHAWLIGPLQAPMGRAPERAPAMQVVVLTPPPEPTPEPAPQAPPPPAPGPEPTMAPAPAEPPPLLAAPEPSPSTELPRPADERPVDWTAGPRPPEQVSGTEDSPVEAPAATAPTAPLLVADASARSASDAAAGNDIGRPSPVYQTQLPARGFRLEYRVERGGTHGVGWFRVDFEEDGQYRAELQAEDGQRMVMDWVSRGRLDTAGVAPQRMVERQKGKDARAVNFQRDQGVISFSGSSRALALQTGAQDRASVLLQLMGIARAQPGGLQVGQEVRLQVANARGQAGEWRFEVAGEEAVDHRGARLPTVRLVREPTQPYDQRIEVWLAREAGYLPAGLRLTTLPGREPVSLWLANPLPALDGPAGRPP